MCQACGNELTKILNLGYMPPPNDMPKCEGHDPGSQTWLPTELMFCESCELAQLGYVPDQRVAFPNDYPYRSAATPALKRNFEGLARSLSEVVSLKPKDLVVDIGSNDGTLLECFDTKRLGIEPTVAAIDAERKGIPTVREFFNGDIAERVREAHGVAKVITCANCFAHMPNVHDVIVGIKRLLSDDGIFVSESHYLLDLIAKLQYDTIYAEHLRYYSVRSITNLLAMHGLQVFGIERIFTHGGSIRVFARKGEAVASDVEPNGRDVLDRLNKFALLVQENRRQLLRNLDFIKAMGGKIVGIGAPSRASTVISYCRLDRGLVSYVCEQSHSDKLGRFMPGTDIPVVDENILYAEQPEAAILFSWHLADELVPKIRAKGYRGKIILPCSATVIDKEKAVAA